MQAMGGYDWYNDFKNFCIKNMGISGMQFHYWEKTQETLYNNVQASLTPYVPEPNKLDVTMVDIFSRLMMDRKLWLAGPVNDQMSTVVQSQLLFLEQQDSSEVTIHVDTPGGSVKSGLSIVDTMTYIKPDIVTINTGMAASMGSVLLGAGTKGKRYTLPHSKVMLHQVSSGAQGTISDMNISINEANKYNTELFRLLGSYCGKNPEVVIKDADRDFWLTSEEAVDYGIVDSLVK